MSPIFVIEHLDGRVWKWSFLEYQHISSIVGKEQLWFTNTKNSRLNMLGNVIPQSVSELDLGRPSGENVILPYRYVLQNGKPVLAPGLREHLLSQKGF